ncbi:MAG: hypothetical protein LC795_05725 [Acidobacteria bacterium]|nr:hypothetical protein [Acidobacteriota bacterium]
MAATFTAEEFRQHLGSKFGVRLDTPRPVELELIEVKDYNPQPKESEGMERFSLYLQGPGDIMLNQGTFMLEHPSLGELALFMVPIARDPQGFRYEVVFNFYRDGGDG